MSQPRFREDSNRFKAPQQPAAEAAEAAAGARAGEPVAAPVEWRDMSDAWKDGRRLWLTADLETAVEAVWRITRAYNRVQMRFESVKFWARATGAHERLEFEPLGWRPVE